MITKSASGQFNIIGSYGTGKSAFLLAFERNLHGERQDFGTLNGHFGKSERFECWNIIGEYNSLVESVACSPRLTVNASDVPSVLNAIDRYYQAYQESIKKDLGVTIRCIPLDAEEEEGTCVISGKPSKRRVIFGKAY